MEKEIIGLVINDDWNEVKRIYETCHKFNVPILRNSADGIVGNCFFGFNEDGLDTLPIHKINKLKTILYGTNIFYEYLDKKAWDKFTSKLSTYSTNCIIAGGFIHMSGKAKEDFPKWVVECYENGLTAEEVFDLYV